MIPMYMYLSWYQLATAHITRTGRHVFGQCPILDSSCNSHWTHVGLLLTRDISKPISIESRLPQKTLDQDTCPRKFRGSRQGMAPWQRESYNVNLNQ